MGESKHERTLYVLEQATALIEKALASDAPKPFLREALFGLNELMMGLEVEAAGPVEEAANG